MFQTSTYWAKNGSAGPQADSRGQPTVESSQLERPSATFPHQPTSAHNTNSQFSLPNRTKALEDKCEPALERLINPAKISRQQ